MIFDDNSPEYPVPEEIKVGQFYRQPAAGQYLYCEVLDITNEKCKLNWYSIEILDGNINFWNLREIRKELKLLYNPPEPIYQSRLNLIFNEET